MVVLKLGSKGASVAYLCKILGIPEKNIFDNYVNLKVLDYLKLHNLVADGIVGYNTWKSLYVTTRSLKETITEADYTWMGFFLDCEPEALKAVVKVETGGGGGFIEPGKPLILFEGHVFWRELKSIGKNPSALLKGNEDILYPKWDKSKYLGGAKEWTRLMKAEKIDPDCAIKSASWGMFLIMGTNYKLCGCSSVDEFYLRMCKSLYHLFLLGIEFIKNCKLHYYLLKKDWAGFALKYNGSGYKANLYDVKLKKAYEYYKK